ncbi:hypothetical protein [Frankia sp. ACN1ag]|uniref:hypothetical protein n=1 Tax=Frankia sp. ACN1ag TaxID=102891 RepID=UPI00128EA3C0|nr:hypothetical protein [Frankia sp. ACN1ag]
MPTPESLRDAAGVVDAMLGGFLADDEAGVGAIVEGLDHDAARDALCLLAGRMVAVGTLLCGSREAFAAVVAQWDPPGPADLP